MSDETSPRKPPILRATRWRFAPTRSVIICFAHVTNTMATAGDDFEKGPDQGSRATLAIIAEAARIWRAAGQEP